VRKLLTILTILITAVGCGEDEKEIYENVYLINHETHFSLRAKSNVDGGGWIMKQIDSLYSKNGKTIFSYGIPLRGNKKEYHYITNGPIFDEGGELPDDPYSESLKTMKGESMNFYRLIPIEEVWKNN